MPDVDEDELEAELDALGDEIALDEDASYLGTCLSVRLSVCLSVDLEKHKFAPFYHSYS